MRLPQPPTDDEKFLYLKPNKGFLYGFGIISTVLVTAGSVMFAMHNHLFLWYLAFVSLILFYLAVSYMIGIWAKPFDFKAHKLQRELVKGRLMPTVDVFLPCAGEPLEVLENTHRWVAQLDWPKDLLRVWVLDDSHRAEVKNSAEKWGFEYLARPNRGELKKAGNIRYAFARSKGDFILILDADFCPRLDMLREIGPYMALQKDIGIVQTPQFFDVEKDMPWVERGAGAIQELFYRLIQVNRDHWGAPICVGTCALYRRSALEPMGGTYPIEHSEDVHTGFALRARGWRTVYVPLVLAKGVCPDTVAAFATQQHRWCSGSTSLGLNRELFWGTKMPLMARLCFLSGMGYYWATALGLFLTPIPGLLMVHFAPEHVFWWNAAFSLPSFAFGTVYMALWNRSPYGLDSVRARFLSYWAHAVAIGERLSGSLSGWVPTGDAKAAKKSKVYIRLLRLAWTWNLTVLVLGVWGFIRAAAIQPFWHLAPFGFFLLFFFWLQTTALSDR